MSTAAQAFLRLWEDAIIAKVFDEQIMICKMSGAMISDMLTRSPIKERLVSIDGEATDVADGKPGNSDESNVIFETTNTIKENPKCKQIADDGKFDQWLQFARKRFERNCVLFADPGTNNGVRDLLLSAPAGRLLGTCGGQGPYVGVVYSCSRAGEASSRSHLRIAPFREQHCHRMIKGAMQAGAAANDITVQYLSGAAFHPVRW